MSLPIQRVVLRQFYNVNIHCPFCGAKVVFGAEEGSDAGTMVGLPCAHTLFIGHDVDLEYRSPAFNEHLGLKADEDLHGDNIDELTDRVTLQDAVKIVGLPRPNAGAGSYVGFAPS
jgi:hypothetical protein